jgi:hypothetical protein
VFYVLRQVAQHRKMNSPEPVDCYVARLLASSSKINGLQRPPTTIADLEASLARLLPGLKDWR